MDTECRTERIGVMHTFCLMSRGAPPVCLGALKTEAKTDALVIPFLKTISRPEKDLLEGSNSPR